MAISMKDLDPAFQEVGHKVGIEIWRVKDFRPVVIPRLYYGKFYSGNSYIILQTTALRSGVFHYDIHFWLGKSTIPEEATAAATKAVELDAALGGRAVQFREAEGCETDKFLSYFKPCIIPIEGSDTVGLDKVGNVTYCSRLFLCKGKHVIRLKEVPFSRSSLNHEDIFVLDTEFKIFQFNGVASNIHERAKVLEVVQYFKENYHQGKCEVAIIEDGKFVADADSGEFWGLFGGFAPLSRKGGSLENSALVATSKKLYQILGRQEKKIEDCHLKGEMLDTNNCYILDCGVELFTWLGRHTSLDERKDAVSFAEDFISRQNGQIKICSMCIIEGFEPMVFKSKFGVWPVSNCIPVSEDGRGKVAVLLKQHGFNVKGLLKAVPLKEKNSPLLNSYGKLQVWRVNGDSRALVPPNKHGKFYSQDCYVVLYSYEGNQREDYYLCSWLGNQSTVETKAAAMNAVNEVATSLNGNAVQVQICEEKEPIQFLALFDKFFLVKGNISSPPQNKFCTDDTSFIEGVALFEVHRKAPHNYQAYEVATVATSLNSSRCFILQIETIIFTWYGKSSTLEEQEATEILVQTLKQGKPINSLKEGSEPELFWNALGGKKVYLGHQEVKETAKDPRLFSCNFRNGDLKVTEVFNFTQDDLLSDEILILDCYTEIFVWVGQHVDAKYKQNALNIGQNYLDHVAAYEDVSLNCPIYKIIEESEPPFFTTFFCWDSSKSMMHIDPFQRKLLLLKGQQLQSTEVLKSRKRSPANQKGSISVAPRSLSQKHERAGIEKIRLSRSDSLTQNIPTSFGRSAAVAALSSIFETGKDEGASPKSSIRKLSALSLETLGRMPDSTPRATLLSPRAVASPRTATIAALSSFFEPSDDKGLAWSALALSRTKSVHVEDTNDDDSSTPQKTEEMRAASTFPYEQLRASNNDTTITNNVIDKAKRESYLSPKEFYEIFHMEKETFYQLPKWKQDKYKLMVDLF